MQLSEALVLGSLAVKPVARIRHFGDAACAIGMTEVAVGARPGRCMEDFWPWVMKQKAPDTPPCGSWHCMDSDGVQTRNYTRNYVSIIAHMFNQHVMGDGTWTIEMLADYLRSVEPAETTPEPSNAVAMNAARPELVGEKL